MLGALRVIDGVIVGTVRDVGQAVALKVFPDLAPGELSVISRVVVQKYRR